MRDELEFRIKEKDDEILYLRREIERYKMREEAGTGTSEEGFFEKKISDSAWMSSSNALLLQNIFLKNPSAILIADSNGRINLCNENACRIFGYSLFEFKTKNIDDLVPKTVEDHEALRQHYFKKPVNKSMGLGRDIYGRRRDGTVFPVEVGLTHLVIGNEKYAMASVIDLTYRNKLKETLNETNRQLIEEKHTLEGVIAQIPGVAVEMEFDEKPSLKYMIGDTEGVFGVKSGRVDAQFDFDGVIVDADTRQKRLLAIRNACKYKTDYELSYKIKSKASSDWVLEKGRYTGLSLNKIPQLYAVILTIIKE